VELEFVFYHSHKGLKPLAYFTDYTIMTATTTTTTTTTLQHYAPKELQQFERSPHTSS
jgi:hypothetical protein